MEPSNTAITPPVPPSGPIAGAPLAPPEPSLPPPPVASPPSEPLPPAPVVQAEPTPSVDALPVQPAKTEYSAAPTPTMPATPPPEPSPMPQPQPVAPAIPDTAPTPDLTKDVLREPRLSITPPGPTAPPILPEQPIDPASGPAAQAFVGTDAAATDMQPAFTDDGKPRRGKKGLILGLVGVLVVILIGVGVYIGLKALSKPTKYGTSDLVSLQTNGYTISYPKEWKDSSSNQKLLGALGTSGSSVSYSDLKVYTNKLNHNGDWAQSVLAAADASDGVPDSTITQSTTLQKQLVATLNQAISQASKDMGCKSSSNQTSSSALNTSNFLIMSSISFNCTLTDGNYHVAFEMGLKNSKVEFMVLATLMNDWNLNSSFYTNNVINTFKAT
jgi:hypothetical protein